MKILSIKTNGFRKFSGEFSSNFTKMLHIFMVVIIKEKPTFYLLLFGHFRFKSNR